MNDVILVHEYIASVLPEVIGNPSADGRVVVAHLGSGASMCAMRRRRSVATTMGFTALDGPTLRRLDDRAAHPGRFESPTWLIRWDSQQRPHARHFAEENGRNLDQPRLDV
jgi:hypothetical protein